ncbi:hypothetical protein NLC35_00050 [Candidatus Aminicenantes bacterium AC-334-K16]|jgi:hypothetical protein|nr:hypothetical protein [Candidatus Aminicenantes bacterium AC-334-K16]
MKKRVALALLVPILILGTLSCKKKETAPVAGKAEPVDMLILLPQESQAVFFGNLGKLMNLKTVNEAIQKDENYQKYQEFIQQVGIDPQKDVYYACGALIVDPETQKQYGAGVVNLKYDPEKVLTYIKAQAEKEGNGEFREEDYNGVTIYIGPTKENEEEGGFAFLDNSNIIVGTTEGIKAIIDVAQGKRPNCKTNENLMNLLMNVNQEAIFWGGGFFPSEKMDKMATQNPMMANLRAVKAGTIAFDYDNQTYSTEIKIFSDDEQKVKQLADFVNGLKSMGAMAAAQKPVFGELLNNIQINSEPDKIIISLELTEDLLHRLEAESKKESQEK